MTHRRIAALWYVWGAQDHGQLRDIEAVEFSEFHAGQTQDYVDGQRSQLPSVQDALTEYVERLANVRAGKG